MKRILRYTCLLILFFFSQNLFAQKNIYITLDVSGSMRGQKYNLANYGAQVISLLNHSDKVQLIVCSKPRDLSNNQYQSIQVGISVLGSVVKSQIEDIKSFNELFNPLVRNQELFIIGDGIWGKHPEIENKFLQHVNSGNLRVSYLGIMINKNSVSEFESFLNNNNIGKIYKVTSNKEIINAINVIAEEITGVSAIPDNKINDAQNCLSFTTELPLKKIQFLYQDFTTLNNIPEIDKIIVNGKDVNFVLLGSPSNERFENGKGGLMSSRIYEMTNSIPQNTKVEVCFKTTVDKSKLLIFPTTDINFGQFGVQIQKGNTSIIDENTFGVCKENNEATVTIDFAQGNTTLDNGIIQSTKVYVVSNGKSYQAVYDKGIFTAKIPLTGETTTYRIESELEGYFRKNSGEKKIVKTDDCKVQYQKPKVRKLPPMNMGSITLDQLNRDGKITGVIVDEETGVSLDPKYFQFDIDNNYPVLFKSVKLDFVEENKFELTVEPRGYWCDCFIPDDISLDLLVLPKEGEYIDGKQYDGFETTMNLKVIKNDSWFSRCKWLIISMLASAGLLWLFILLTRKKRFRRGAKIVFKYPNAAARRSLTPQYITTDFTLRKKGFGAWLNRWLNPFGTEKRTLNFDSINTSLPYTATRSHAYVQFPKSSFDENTMKHDNYDPDSRDKFIKMGENSDLEVHYGRLGTKTKNYLSYSIPKSSWDDIATYRFVLGICILGLIVYLLLSGVLLIQSLFS